MMPITAATPVTIYTGGHPQCWQVSHVGPDSGTSVTLEYENCVTTVDKSWVTFDSQVGTLVLQRLGFFNDSISKRTTNSFEIWQNILNPDKMMNGETLTVLLEWTLHGSPTHDTLGLPMAQSKTWLVTGPSGSPGNKTTTHYQCPGIVKNGSVLIRNQYGARRSTTRE